MPSQEETEKYSSVLSDLSPAASLAIGERSKEATFSYLLRYGIPATPSDVLTLFDSLFTGVIAWAVGDGYVTLTDKSRATEEEKAESTKVLQSILNSSPVHASDAGYGYI